MGTLQQKMFFYLYIEQDEQNGILYINGNFFDFYICPPPNVLTNYIMKKNGKCVFSE